MAGAVGAVVGADYDGAEADHPVVCLLYTSDAADERSSVDLGGRRIIKKKNRTYISSDGSIKKEISHKIDTEDEDTKHDKEKNTQGGRE